MPRKRKYRRRKTYNYEPFELNLHPEAKKAIFVIVLLAIGALGVLSFFGFVGQAGRILDNALAVVFGSLRLVFSVSLIVLAGMAYLGKGVKFMTYIGLLLFFCSLNGFVHLLTYHDTDLIAASQLGQGGGYVGLFLSFPLLQFTGFSGAVLITLALLLISLVIIFNTSIKTVFAIIKFIGIFIYKLFKNLYELIASSKNKDFSPFARREYDEDEDEDNENEDEKTGEKTRTSVPGNIEKKEQAILPLKRKRARIDIPLTLLSKRISKASPGDLKNNIAVIQKTFINFGIDVEMGPYNIGPTVTQYTFKPAEGIRLSKISSLSNNLALALAAHPIRIEAPIPGKSLVGIEVPNQEKAIVNLRDLLASKEFKNRKSNLAFTLGKDVAGDVWTADLGKMPHLLVAGATGSGKSVCLNTIILSLLFSNGPDDLKLILVDPKRVEFPIYNGIPHLLTPVITDVKKTVNSLKWAIGEMERRLDVLSHANKRDINSYNASARETMPYIVIVIDELADLMSTSGVEIEACIIRLAQLARAVGIHLVVATQRPSVDVITGLIKANIINRVAFSVGSAVDSRTILDTGGAEKLLGQGDMLFITPELSKPKRLQGAFVTEGDVTNVVKFIKQNYSAPEYQNDVVEKQKVKMAGGIIIDAEDGDPLLEDAIDTIMSAGKASASLLQRRLSVGYARAARLLDILEEQGVIGPADGAKPRELLMRKEDLTHMEMATEPLHDQNAYKEAPEENNEDENTENIIDEYDIEEEEE
ncbi:DNA translocase FtsK [Candidatus Parcubacteria bacterium]|nr:DNA translocase FtsK [Patescibacteria group bacterium]MCG2693774.1 DNA translocase FtsK [Candidatus Parcubacteria bacterium]